MQIFKTKNKINLFKIAIKIPLDFSRGIQNLIYYSSISTVVSSMKLALSAKALTDSQAFSAALLDL